jgi:hypothetical protein
MPDTVIENQRVSFHMLQPKTTSNSRPARRETQGYERIRYTFPERAQKFGMSMPSPEIRLAATGSTIATKTAIEAMERSTIPTNFMTFTV